MFEVNDRVISLDQDVIAETSTNIVRGHLVARIVSINGEWATCEVIGYVDTLESRETKPLIRDDLAELRLSNCIKYKVKVSRLWFTRKGA